MSVDPHFGVTQDDQKGATFPSFCDWHMRHRAEMEKLDAQIAGLRAERADRDLRDRFAMAALTGMMCRITRESMSIEHPESVVAGIAYKFADAMLAARKQ